MTTTLDGALEALRHGQVGPACVRAATRAADDVEVEALEASGEKARETLMNAVRRAREEISAVRDELRRSASSKRAELLDGATEKEEKEDQGAAAAVAKDINDSLRRSTGIVNEEVARTTAAGRVIKESGRTMRKTRDKHRSYGDGLKDGKSTLTELRRAEKNANFVLAASFIIFGFVVAYVVSRRLQRSTMATILVRPVLKLMKQGKKLIARKEIENIVVQEVQRERQEL